MSTVTVDGKQYDLEDFLESHPKGKPLTPDGREVLDGTPMAPPVGYKRQPSLAEQIRDMVRSERLAQEMQAAGLETFDEAEDFDIGDDYDPTSPYEADFDLATPAELRRRAAEAEEAAKPKPAPTPPPKPAKQDQAPKEPQDDD